MLAKRIDAVGLDGALFERDVTRTLERVSKAGGLTIHWSIPRTRDALGHSGVQPWSAGAIFPAVITIIERHEPFGACWGLDAQAVSRSYRLTLDGHSEEYATWDDAERVALALLDSPVMRRSWNDEEPYPPYGLGGDPDETIPGVDAYGVT